MNADNLAESPAPLVPEFRFVAGRRVSRAFPQSQRNAPLTVQSKGKKTTRKTRTTHRRMHHVVVVFAVLVAGGVAHVRRPGVLRSIGSMLPTLQ